MHVCACAGQSAALHRGDHATAAVPPLATIGAHHDPSASLSHLHCIISLHMQPILAVASTYLGKRCRVGYCCVGECMSMDARQCRNERPRLGLLKVTQKLREYNILRVSKHLIGKINTSIIIVQMSVSNYKT